MTKLALLFLFLCCLAPAANGQTQKADALASTGEYSEAFPLYQQAAAAGDLHAERMLGKMYLTGTGVALDYTRALSWLTKAANGGSIEAEFDLGLLYDRGPGAPQNYETAIHWYQMAAYKGSAPAQDFLGMMYEFGHGVPQNDPAAVSWFRKAAEQGYANAQYDLGTMYANGKGVPRNLALASNWFEKAAAQGYEAARIARANLAKPPSSTSLAPASQTTHSDDSNQKGTDLFLLGNYPAALAQFQRGADGGSSTSQTYLGIMYRYGLGTTEDDPKAALWFTTAASQGNAAAQACLGEMFFLGPGIPKSANQALLWLKKAAAQGDPMAQIDLANIYGNGLGVPKDVVLGKSWLTRARTSAAGPYKPAMDLSFLFHYQFYASGPSPEAAREAFLYSMGELPAAKTFLARRDRAMQSLRQVSAPPIRNRQQTSPAPEPGPDRPPIAVQQGTCAVVYIAQEHDEDYGTHYIWGAAWAAATLADAQSSAMTVLRQRANSSFDSRYVNTDSSGCGVAHGAVAGKLKQNWQTGALLGDGIYDVLTSKLADSTDEAISAAMSHCAGTGGAGGAGESCSLLMKW